VAVADSVSRGGGITVGLLAGQDVFTVPTMQAKLEAQLRGLGAGFLPEPMARPHLAAGRLVEVMPQWQAGELGIYAVYPSRKHVLPKTRALIDFLVQAFERPSWEPSAAAAAA